MCVCVCVCVYFLHTEYKDNSFYRQSQDIFWKVRTFLLVLTRSKVCLKVRTLFYVVVWIRVVCVCPVCVCVCAVFCISAVNHGFKCIKKRRNSSICKCGYKRGLVILKQKWKCPIPPQVKQIPIGQTLDQSAWRGVKSTVLICSVCDESTIRATAGHRGGCPLFDWACPLWATVCGWNIRRCARWGPGVHAAAAAEGSSSSSCRKEEKPVGVSDDVPRCRQSATGPDATWSYSLSETTFVSEYGVKIGKGLKREGQWFIGETWRQASACRNAEQCVERGHGSRVASDGGGGLHPANWSAA